MFKSAKVVVLPTVVLVVSACGAAKLTAYDGTATFRCLANRGAKVDRPGADYIALEAAAHAVVTLANGRTLNVSLWKAASQEHDGLGQYRSAGASSGQVVQSGNAILSWDGTPSVRDRATVEGCLLKPAATSRPSSAQRGAIAHALHADTRDIANPNAVTVSNIRLSAHDPSFAMAGIFNKKVGGARVLLHVFQGKWRVLTLGSSLSACGLPNQVAVDLSPYWEPCTKG